MISSWRIGRAGLARSCALGLLVLGVWGPARAAIPIEHWTHPSGARVYLVSSPSIPMLDVQLNFDGGSRRDPSAKAGLADVTADMLSAGVAAESSGAAALDENQLSEAWLDLGAQFGADASGDRFTVSLRSLTQSDLLERAVALAARQLGAPAWPEPVWTRDRERSIAALKEADNRPGTIAARTFSRAVFGDHPYGYEPTEQTLKSISVPDMRDFYRRHVVACRAEVSLVGAIDRAGADRIVTRLMSALEGHECVPLVSIPDVKPLERASNQRLPFDAAQAQVLIGQPGMARDDPDFFPLYVGNYILGGGGFVSRLTTEVREKRGLSYSVYSYFAPGLHAGAFQIGLTTRPDQADQATRVARDVLSDYVAKGPTEAELQAAKDYLVNSFALRLDSNRKLLDNVTNIAWNRLPLDYLDRWTERVQAVSVADIQRAFARTLQPQRMVTVTVGAQP
jgi:zinc protease